MRLGQSQPILVCGRASLEAINLWGGSLNATHGLRVGEMEKVPKVPEGKGRRQGVGVVLCAAYKALGSEPGPSQALGPMWRVRTFVEEWCDRLHYRDELSQGARTNWQIYSANLIMNQFV